jgi:hypothetical protein
MLVQELWLLIKHAKELVITGSMSTQLLTLLAELRLSTHQPALPLTPMPVS